MHCHRNYGIFVIRNPEKLKHVTAEWIREAQK